MFSPPAFRSSYIKFVTALVIIFTQLVGTRAQYVRYCCRVNATCINRDEVKANELDPTSVLEASFRIRKGKPCTDLEYEDDENFTLHEV